MQKKPFDPLSLLLINDAYKSIEPEHILTRLKAAYTNLASLSSTVSRLRTRLRKIGLPEEFTRQLHLGQDAYRSLRRRSRSRLLSEDAPAAGHGSSGAESQMDVVVGGGDNHEDDHTDSRHKVHRVAVGWANTTLGIPRMFTCAYQVLQWRSFPSRNDKVNDDADPAHVYAALNLITGLGPEELLDPNVAILYGSENTRIPHTGNFESYWICVGPSNGGAQSPYDRPCLFLASRVAQAVGWMRRALNLVSDGKLSPRPAVGCHRAVIRNRRHAWARRALLKTFGACVAHDPIGGSSRRNCNPDHRFTQAVYVATVAANYFEGFRVQDAAKYLNIQGDFSGLQVPFTPMVGMLKRWVRQARLRRPLTMKMN